MILTKKWYLEMAPMAPSHHLAICKTKILVHYELKYGQMMAILGHLWLTEAGVQPSPCFSYFLARTIFVLESLREAENPGQDAFFGIYALFCQIFGDLCFSLSNFVATVVTRFC